MVSFSDDAICIYDHTSDQRIRCDHPRAQSGKLNAATHESAIVWGWD